MPPAVHLNVPPSEDRERTLDSAMDKVMLSLTNFVAEMEREKASQRTYDALVRKAKAGYVACGKVYGYDNVEVLSPVARGRMAGRSGFMSCAV